MLTKLRGHRIKVSICRLIFIRSDLVERRHPRDRT